MKKMKSTAKGFIAGAVVSSMLFGATAFAANNQLLVDVVKFKFMFHDVEKQQSDDGLTFIYKGTTYVPLRFISEGLGEKVDYDGKNKTIWVGKRSGAHISLTAMDYARYDVYDQRRISFNAADQRITGTAYKNNITMYLDTHWKDEHIASVEYNLDSKYQALTALAGIEDSYRNTDGNFTVTFYGDGKELATYENIRGGNHPVPVNVNVEGVLKLKIEFTTQDDGGTIMLAEPKLFQ